MPFIKHMRIGIDKIIYNFSILIFLFSCSHDISRMSKVTKVDKNKRYKNNIQNYENFWASFVNTPEEKKLEFRTLD